MRTYKAKLSDLDNVISQVLTDYGENITEGMKVAISEVAKNAKEEVKAKSPVGKGPRRGRYRKGWAVQEEESRLSKSAVIHNRTDYQLAHLLEKGHVLRNGKRWNGIEHIAPAEQKAIKEIEKAVEKLAQG